MPMPGDSEFLFISFGMDAESGYGCIHTAVEDVIKTNRYFIRCSVEPA